jgi:hypothetical protein
MAFFSTTDTGVTTNRCTTFLEDKSANANFGLRFSQDLMLVDNELLGIVDFVECESNKI